MIETADLLNLIEQDKCNGTHEENSTYHEDDLVKVMEEYSEGVVKNHKLRCADGKIVTLSF